MHLTRIVVVTVLILTLAGAAQSDKKKTKVSREPLRAEQIAVYHVVLENYTKDSKGALNVANRTEAFERSDSSRLDGCAEGIELEPEKNSRAVVHEIDVAVAPAPKFVLVDPDQQRKEIKQKDPQKLVRRAIDDGKAVTEKEVEDSVREAFDAGMLTLSEIAFDKRHEHALVSYDFLCGELCGHGGTLLLDKLEQKWKVSKTCSDWVS